MKNKTITDILFSMLYQFTNIFLPLISAPIVSRAIGAEGVGIQSVVNANTSYFVMFALLGLQNYGNRTIAMQIDKETADKTFFEIYAMQFISGIISLISFCLLIAFCDIGENKRYYQINVIYVLSAILDISWYFYGKSAFKFISLRSIAVRVVSFLATVLFVYNENHVGRYVFIISASHLLSALSLWGYMYKNVKFHRPKRLNIVQHIKPNLILFIPIVAMQIYRVMDKTMLGLLRGNVDSGLYAAADRILSVTLVVFTAIGTVMMPHSSKLVSQGKTEKLLASIRNSMQLQMMIAYCLSFGMLCISEEALLIYYGEGFEKAGMILQIMSFVPVITAWKNVVRNQYLMPNQMDRIYGTALIVGAVCNLCVNIILIPINGACGAAIGTVAAEVMSMLILTLPVYKSIQALRMMCDMIPFLVGGGIMTVFLMCVKSCISGWRSLITIIALATIVYFIAVILFLRLFDKQRFQQIIQLIYDQK